MRYAPPNKPALRGGCYDGNVAHRRSKGEAERRLELALPSAVRDTRRALRWTQRMLADRCDLSQSAISRFESGRIQSISLQEAGRLLDALGIQTDLALRRPFVAAPLWQHDAAHARTLAYVSGRMRTMGWDVRLELEIIEGRARGWIDLLAFLPARRALFIAEIKAGLDDMGAAQRQLGWYVRASTSTARQLGWRAEHRRSAVLVLATTANDELITANHGLIRAAFPARATDLHAWLSDPTESAAPGLALVDPRSRRRRWLIPSALDGRSTELRYASYSDFMTRVRRGGGRSG